MSGDNMNELPVLVRLELEDLPDGHTAIPKYIEELRERIIVLEKALGNICNETMAVSGHPDFAFDKQLDLIYEVAIESQGVLNHE